MNTTRNGPCSCNSGKKFKHCCGRLKSPPTNSLIEQASIPDAIRSALAHQQAGRLAQAEAIYRRILLTVPYNPDALHLSGAVAHQKGNMAAAIDLYRQVLNLKPDYAEVHNNLGGALKDHGKLKEAVVCFREALSLKPDYAEAHYNLGNTLKQQGYQDEAAACFRRALDLKPDYAEAHINLGNTLKEQGRFDEAVACYRNALDYKPDFAEGYNNLALALHDQGRLDEAVAHYRKALGLKPGYADAEWSLSLLHLSRGEFEQGWRLYESRYHKQITERRVMAPDHLPFPQWQGQSLLGKSLVLWSEQGHGDEIHFCRYDALLKRLGAKKITLVCKTALKALFRTLAHVDAVIAMEEATVLPAHDYWSLLCSVPLHCGTTVDAIPAETPYLHASTERIAHWASRIPASGIRIGLVWKGSTIHRNDAHRSIEHLQLLAPLWSVPNTVFVSLQKGQGEDEAAFPPEGQPIISFAADIREFADTAAVVSLLDLVICVDTAIAHLAGAMNKPCWVMLPEFGTDWRWLRKREDSPWYPSLRLFRQSADGDWESVIDRIRYALADQFR